MGIGSAVTAHRTPREELAVLEQNLEWFVRTLRSHEIGSD